MKIQLIINFNPFASSSASGNRYLSLIEGIASLGANINLLIYNGYSSDCEKQKFQVEGNYKNISYEYLLPISLKGYLRIRFHNYIGYLIRNQQLLLELKRRLKNHKGIIWTDSSNLSFRFAVAYKKSNPESKLFIEMSEFLDIHHYQKGNFLQRLQGDARQSLFEKKAFYAFDAMALMTKVLLEHYKKFPYPHPKFLHLPMTVDIERFINQKELLPGFISPYICFVGVMSDAKDGVSILIKAFNYIKDKYCQHKLYLIGDWNYDTPKHLQLIKKFRLENKVFWMKAYSREKIPNIICNADLLVLPRPDSKQARGGFPTKLGEYLASGIPVCATTVGEIPNYLEDNQSIFFAEPGSVDSLAEAMDKALCDSKNSKKVGLKGQKVAETEFNKEIQTKKLYDFLKSL